MKYTEDESKEKPIFIIEENPEVVPGQDESERPTIVIERHNSTKSEGIKNIYMMSSNRRLLLMIFVSMTIMLICLCAFLGWRYYNYYNNVGVPVSATIDENIQLLQTASAKETPQVIMTSDSILGVAINLYEIRGLKGEITFEEPDSTDTDVYLYSRCADHTTDDPATNRNIGTLVVNGNVIQSDISRVGYCAMLGDRTVIGVSKSDKIKDFIAKNDGYMFRQYVLVSDNVLPPKFYLHGKVERRALGRMGERLFYIETRHKETMWDFADAIRELGFVDAIYITGGKDYSYYRTSDGERYGIGDFSRYPHKRPVDIPWLVFKKP